MVKERNILMAESTAIILLWALVVCSPLFFMDGDSGQDWRGVYVMWAECAVVGFAFFVNRLILMPRLFFTLKYTKYFISLIFLFLLLGVFIFYFDGVNLILSVFGIDSSDFVVPAYGEFSSHGAPRGGVPLQNIPMPSAPPGGASASPMGRPLGGGASASGNPPVISVIPPMVTVLILSVIVIALDMGLNIATRWFISQQKQSEINREQITAQLSNLQSQVSPHFFMNTLNNIHALVDIDPPRAKQTIIELSALMDYLLYESSSKSLVSLNRELEFLSSYISLMRLRYPRHVQIDFSYGYDVPVVKIPPLLFLNFIENAFKYGIDYEKDSFVRIWFYFDENSIEMHSLNTNHSANVRSHRHGLGISNSRKRLDLLYGNRYSLEIIDTDETYSVNLKTPILL